MRRSPLQTGLNLRKKLLLRRLIILSQLLRRRPRSGRQWQLSLQQALQAMWCAAGRRLSRRPSLLTKAQMTRICPAPLSPPAQR